MIPDILKLTQVQRYIFQQTGVMIKQQMIRKWAKQGQFNLIQPLDKSKYYTTKRSVDSFIRRNIRKESEQKQILTYKRLNKNEKRQ